MDLAAREWTVKLRRFDFDLLGRAVQLHNAEASNLASANGFSF
jgi:hypothetical protein